MSKHETIFILVIGALFFIGLLITCHLYSLQSDRNKDLKLENSDLIARNIQLQDEIKIQTKSNQKLSSKLDNANGILAKKKELLEIQDKLLEENNIKH